MTAWSSRWGTPGIYLVDRPRPFRVRFTRNRRDIHVGAFHSLAAARAAAKAYITANPRIKKPPTAITEGQPNGTL